MNTPISKKKPYWIYILHCENNTYYTGYTTNLMKRYQSHKKGTGCKYTRSFKPISLAQSWEIMGDKSLAMKLEHRIKKLSRTKKEELIASPHLLYTLLCSDDS
ncbi:GIY-YIG nuclease family protein [Legionella oakridgensis]|uniref:Nuclease n=2 Tax=Legionella oakridgensis TaxID=29423 RepID=A0A0W0X0C0_9GAMM|nr:GIY-YIG nuclease family protein [Legionella oakridgensis]AHE67168.1 putative endonuclease containing a URI domain [Legionella oakridgensis ATCC 33761 = DSM 21215]ETO93137.1 putative endonuclease [Legionella oakridgensis RV-2-2007]KTD38027.1 nuclease [Legionella oakridgensis]STY20251.1 nuclease [Legionella longbeachae]